MISLSSDQIVDLFFRFAAVGQLLLLAILAFKQTSVLQRCAQSFLIVTAISYLLLTAPIEDHHYGLLRRPLLLFTDLSATAILLFAYTQLKPDLPFSHYPKWAIWLLGLWSVLMCYFFLFTTANHPLHDINHAVGLTLLMITLFLGISGYQDDLIDARRKFRLILVIGCALYMGILTVFELSISSIKDHWLFSLCNSASVLAATSFAAFRIVKRTEIAAELSQKEIKLTPTSSAHNPMLSALQALMDAEFYTRSNLTIALLAQELGVPQHQLRQLINQSLGYSNFSHFLNSYRIPAICAQLQDPKFRQTPILTLALNMGYGSIASFNRAFKQQMKITPTEFRDQF